MQVRIEQGRNQKAIVLTPDSLAEWYLLASMGSMTMLQSPGASLFLTAAPYTESAAVSPKEPGCGSVTCINEPSR
jgi:hypothetical protein